MDNSELPAVRGNSESSQGTSPDDKSSPPPAEDSDKVRRLSCSAPDPPGHDRVDRTLLRMLACSIILVWPIAHTYAGHIRQGFAVTLVSQASVKKLSSPSDRLSGSKSPSRLSRVSTGRTGSGTNGGSGRGANGHGSNGAQGSGNSFTGASAGGRGDGQASTNGDRLSRASTGSASGGGSFTQQRRRSDGRRGDGDVPVLSPAAANVRHLSSELRPESGAIFVLQQHVPEYEQHVPELWQFAHRSDK